MPKNSSTLRQALRQVGPYLHLGGTLMGCITIGALLGHWLDEKYETEPWMLLGGSLFGIASGFYHFFKVVLKTPEHTESVRSKEEEKSD